MIAVDKMQVARQFSRAARQYPRVSELQNTMAEHLLRLLPDDLPAAETVLDLGCGAGYLTRELSHQLPLSKVYGVDIAPGMIAVARQELADSELPAESLPEFLEADIEKLPFSDCSAGLVVSNASLQWTDLHKSLQEIQRVLEPGGVAALTCFVEGTLGEWQAALDRLGLNSLHAMPSAKDFTARAEQAGLLITGQDIARYKMEHSSAAELLQSTKKMGATNARMQRRQGLMGRQSYARLLAALEAEFPASDYSSTYQAGFWLVRKAG